MPKSFCGAKPGGRLAKLAEFWGALYGSTAAVGLARAKAPAPGSHHKGGNACQGEFAPQGADPVR